LHAEFLGRESCQLRCSQDHRGTHPFWRFAHLHNPSFFVIRVRCNELLYATVRNMAEPHCMGSEASIQMRFRNRTRRIESPLSRPAFSRASSRGANHSPRSQADFGNGLLLGRRSAGLPRDLFHSVGAI
jgi:hypothetical protein